MFQNFTAVGNLTKNVELKTFEKGSCVAYSDLAITKVWYKEGSKKEETFFITVKAWGKRGETFAEWCKKGTQILVSGRLQNNDWEKDGKKHYKIELYAEDIKFLNRTKTKEETNSPEQEEAPF